MATTNTELGFITELLISEDINTVSDKEITAKYLTGKYKQAFKFIQDHKLKYGKVPSLQAFKKRFPSFDLAENEEGDVGTDEEMTYWCDELRNKKKHNTIADGLDDAISKVGELDTEGAYKTLKSTIMTVENEIVLADRLFINRNTQKRKEDYLKRQKSGGITGIPTFNNEYDLATGGMNNGELTGTMAFTGIGKTWWIIIRGVLQARNGYKVAMGTTEMSTKMMMRRIDAVWCMLNYSLFVKGQLKPDQEKRYFEYLEKEAPKLEDILVVEHVDDVLQFSAMVDRYSPDVAYLDGAYIMQDEDEDDDWKAVRNVVRGLHQLCLSKNIPIGFTTQAKEAYGNTLKTINFSKAIAQECDVFEALEQDEQMYNDKEVALKFLKLREGKIGGKIYMHWDFDAMNYGSIYREKAEVEGAPARKDTKGVVTID